VDHPQAVIERKCIVLRHKMCAKIAIFS
jgi:hypothetical protein